MKKISFSDNGQRLQGTLFYPEKVKPKNPAVLFLHGWRSSELNMQGRAEVLTKLGFICLTFNQRGNSTTEGDITVLTRQDFLNDVLVAYDFLSIQQNVDQSNISVIGSSFGGYLAILLTRGRSIKNLVLRVPANYSGEMSINHNIFSGDNSASFVAPKFKEVVGRRTNAIEALHDFSGNVLIVESEKDDIIPHGIIQDYIDAVTNKRKLTHVVMNGADHAIKSEKFRAVYDSILTDWFKDKV